MIELSQAMTVSLPLAMCEVDICHAHLKKNLEGNLSGTWEGHARPVGLEIAITTFQRNVVRWRRGSAGLQGPLSSQELCRCPSGNRIILKPSRQNPIKDLKEIMPKRA